MRSWTRCACSTWTLDRPQRNRLASNSSESCCHCLELGCHGTSPGEVLLNLASQPQRRIDSGPVAGSNLLHAARSLHRRKRITPSEKYLLLLEAHVHDHRACRPRHPKRQQVPSAVLVDGDGPDSVPEQSDEHAPPLKTLFLELRCGRSVLTKRYARGTDVHDESPPHP